MRRAIRSIAILATASGAGMAGCQGDSNGGTGACDPADAALADGTVVDAKQGAGDGAAAEGGADSSADSTQHPTADAGMDSAIDPLADGRAPMDSGVIGPGNDASGTMGSFGGVRVAHLSPDAPAVDFCLAVSPSALNPFQGPMMACRAAQMDAGTAGLSFPPVTPPAGAPPPGSVSVSTYFLMKTGLYDVRVVTAGSPDCSAKLVPDYLTLPINANANSTVALMGEFSPSGTDPALSLAAFADDVAGDTTVRLRFIHAAPGVAAVDFRVEPSGGTFLSVFSGVGFQAAGTVTKAGSAGDGGKWSVDSNGYASMPSSLSGALLDAHAKVDAGTPPGSAAGIPSAAAGSVVTIALVGNPSLGLELLACIDNAASTGTEPYASCKILQ